MFLSCPKKNTDLFPLRESNQSNFLYEKLFSLDSGHNPNCSLGQYQQSLHTIAVQADSEREAAEQVFQSCPDFSFQHFSRPRFWTFGHFSQVLDIAKRVWGRLERENQ